MNTIYDKLEIKERIMFNIALPKGSAILKTCLTNTATDAHLATAHYYFTRVLFPNKPPSEIVLADLPWVIIELLTMRKTHPTVVTLLSQMPCLNLDSGRHEYVLNCVVSNLPLDLKAINWDKVHLPTIRIQLVHYGTSSIFDVIMSCENPIREMLIRDKHSFVSSLVSSNRELLSHILDLGSESVFPVQEVRAKMVSFESLQSHMHSANNIKWVIDHLGVEAEVCVALLEHSAKFMYTPVFKYLIRQGYKL